MIDYCCRNLIFDIREWKINQSNSSPSSEIFGIPKSLFPIFVAFLFDAISVGLAMPLLPFYLMNIGANALQLSIVISANYFAQAIGCLIMGQISDKYGRKPVAMICLLASSVSYICISQSSTLMGVTVSRIISGSFGGLVPVVQSCVADSSNSTERPKYLGRITATFGLGFVLGPALNAILGGFSIRSKVRLCGLFPFLGFLIVYFNFKESLSSNRPISPPAITFLATKENESSSISGSKGRAVTCLVLNGFLIMFAFATEAIYGVFIKDVFGLEDTALSTIFALNGVCIGVFQVFFIKPMINIFGKHVTLLLGNLLLSAGLLGVALSRNLPAHLALFAMHIVGFSIADTALASLISRYSSSGSQGRDLSLNQSAQATARMLSPLVAGYLYELNKTHPDSLTLLLPKGALPFLIGAIFPACAVFIPLALSLWNLQTSRKAGNIGSPPTTPPTPYVNGKMITRSLFALSIEGNEEE